MQQGETYLTTKEAMEILKVSRVTLHRWRKERKIKGAKIGSLVRYKLSEIEKLMR